MSLIKAAKQPSSASSMPGVRGAVKGRFACTERGTRLADRYHCAPLKISKTFPMTQGGQLAVYLMDASPGMLDGDRYEINLELESGARVYLTNQSFTKAHPSPVAGAHLAQHFLLGKDSLLEYFPEPMIPYARSRVGTHTRFDMDEDSVLLFGDILTPGRTHRNERFHYEQVDAKVEVYRSGRLAAWDRFLLQPSAHDFRGAAAFGPYTHMASMWILAPRADAQLLQLLREELELTEQAPVFDAPGHSSGGSAAGKQAGDTVQTHRFGNSASRLTGASMTADRGIVLRMLGQNVWQLQHQLFAARRIARRYLFGWSTEPERK